MDGGILSGRNAPAEWRDEARYPLYAAERPFSPNHKPKVLLALGSSCRPAGAVRRIKLAASSRRCL